MPIVLWASLAPCPHPLHWTAEVLFQDPLVELAETQGFISP